MLQKIGKTGGAILLILAIGVGIYAFRVGNGGTAFLLGVVAGFSFALGIAAIMPQR